MLTTEQVFAYGTLRPPRPNESTDKSRYYLQIVPHVQAIVPAYLPGAELYDLEAYPAARPGQGVIWGDLLTVEPAALLMMDRIEGHPTFYQRDRVFVQAGSRAVEAWIYWAPAYLTQGKRRIASGDWFQAK